MLSSFDFKTPSVIPLTRILSIHALNDKVDRSRDGVKVLPVLLEYAKDRLDNVLDLRRILQPTQCDPSQHVQFNNTLALVINGVGICESLSILYA